MATNDTSDAPRLASDSNHDVENPFIRNSNSHDNHTNKITNIAPWNRRRDDYREEAETEDAQMPLIPLTSTEQRNTSMAVHLPPNLELENVSSEHDAERRQNNTENVSSEHDAERRQNNTENVSSEHDAERRQNNTENVSSEHDAERRQNNTENVSSEHNVERRQNNTENVSSEHDAERRQNNTESVSSEHDAERRQNSTELLMFAEIGNLSKCEAILNMQYVDIDFADEKQMTALHYAVKSNHKDIVDYLLEKSANRCKCDKDGSLPLHYAAHKGYLKCCQSLLGDLWESQLTAVDNDGRTPLIVAAKYGMHHCCRILGIREDIINAKDNFGNTALYFAAKGAFANSVKVLLDDGADPTLANQHDYTPLRESAYHIDPQCLKYIIKKHPNLASEMSLEDSKAVLRTAIDGRSEKCMKYLVNIPRIKENIEVEEGCDEDLLLRCIDKRSYKCSEVLTDSMTSVDVQVGGKLLLHKAAKAGWHDLCLMIIEKNSNALTQVDNNHDTPLHMAVRSKKLKVVQSICEQMRNRKIDLSAGNAKGQTAMHLAAKEGLENITIALLQAGHTSRKRDLDGNTPLHIALSNRRFECCKLLVQRAESLLLRFNEESLFPLDFAFTKRHDNTQILLFILKRTDELLSRRGHMVQKLKDQLAPLMNRIRSYVLAALSAKEKDIIEAIIESKFCEAAFTYPSNTQNMNYRSLIILFPDLALKLHKKYINFKSEDGRRIAYDFSLFEDAFYIPQDRNNRRSLPVSPFDETSYVKKEAKKHHKTELVWYYSHPLKIMIDNEQSELLQDELTQAWLNYKWCKYVRPIHIILMVLNAVYLASLIAYMTTVWNWNHIEKTYEVKKEQFCGVYTDPESIQYRNFTPSVEKFQGIANTSHGLYIWLFVMWILMMFKDLYFLWKLLSMTWDENVIAQNLLQGIQILLIGALMITPFFMCYDSHVGSIQEILSWQCGICAILLIWLQLINAFHQSFISEFMPITKDFIAIFLKVLYFVITFIVIFAFVFHLLLKDQDDFSSVPQSIGSTIAWMLLDLGYGDTFVQETLPYPLQSNLLFFLFITTVGCLIVSLISKDDAEEANTNKFSKEAERIAVFAQVIFQYDVCFPIMRRTFTKKQNLSGVTKWVFLTKIFKRKIPISESSDSPEDQVISSVQKLESQLLKFKEETNKQSVDYSQQVTKLHTQLNGNIKTQQANQKIIDNKLTKMQNEYQRSIDKQNEHLAAIEELLRAFIDEKERTNILGTKVEDKSSSSTDV